MLLSSVIVIPTSPPGVKPEPVMPIGMSGV
jgi:hypothetical protein